MQPDTVQLAAGCETEVPQVRPRRPPAKRRAVIDGRTYWARRRLELIRQFTTELGRAPGARDRVLISNCAAVAVRVEQLDVALTRGDPIDDEGMVRLANTLARLLVLLGLKSAPSSTPKTSALADYLREHGAP
jgi:hypothetical protein